MTVGASPAFSRRALLSGALAASGFSGARPDRFTAPDVIVVGAGAAGVAAARALQTHGYGVVVLESADRIGGRAFTESATFGVPFDHGASWITFGDSNPLIPHARAFGFELRDHSNAGEALFVGDRLANAQERREL